MDTVDRVTLPKPRTPRRAAVGVWHGVVAVVRGVTILPRALLGWWNRSIQARVVIGVLSLSTVLAFLAGWVLLHQVKDGLLVSQRQSALPQAAAGFDTARSRLNAEDVAGVCPGQSTTSICPEFGKFLNQLLDVLAPHEGASGDYAVIMVGPLADVSSSQPQTWAPRYRGQLDVASSVPAAMIAKIGSASARGSYWAYTGLHRTPGASSEPALVVGWQIPVKSQNLSYGLLYVFPLAEQQQTLSVVERGLFGAGAILVVLLSTIAWLVTRQVVTPVRLARRIAERLASGRLEERMHVRGEDDIARLAKSFNQMANGLQRQIRQLEELSRVQRRFVADVSHELRTPLTTVRMASDLLFEARKDFDAPTARSAELLQNELNRFETLLTDLLEISRFDAGAAVLELGDVDVCDVAQQVVDAHAAIAERRGSAIWLTLPDGSAVVQADVRRVQRIARNLVANALEYGEGNDVEVTVTADETMVSLVVRDHGVGLKPGEENLVFNRFWRADPARARTGGGTGLGLSIAIEDTALHGGVLDARGRTGFGSVFRLVLPRRVGDKILPMALPLADGLPALVGGPHARHGPAHEPGAP
ncbi:MAG: MtrAB system histidine kinase MtrB [Actinomycetota bacterium]|jgi:two-component system, OmpR family, sensor histidine kinase MtrB|nr:MtrAB system histidine kinase MtrB [Actinomycetota bacterium]